MMMSHNGMLLPKHLHEDQATAARIQSAHLTMPDGELSPPISYLVDKSLERTAAEIK